MANWGGLPSIVSQIPNDLRNFLQRVKESMDGYMTGPDRFVRISELKSTNIISVDALGNVTGAGAATTNTASGGTTGSTGGTTGGTTVAIDYTPPPPPTGLAATGAITSIILTWDAPVGYTNLSHVEIWRADVDDIGVAVMVGTSLGDMYTDPVGPSMTKYYWIRFISKASIAGPYNNFAGVLGQTSADPAPLLSVLAGAITGTELSTALNTSITQIGTNTTAITNLSTTVGNNTTAIQTAQTSIDGVTASYTVKVDNNGYLSGFGLMSDLVVGGVPTSTFLVSVDTFAVATPATSIPAWAASTAYAVGAFRGITGNTAKMLVCKVAGTSGAAAPSIAGAVGSMVTDGTVQWQIASRVPLSVLTTTQTINGVSVAPGVYVDGATIVNGTIQNAQIANLAVDNAKIASLAVSKLTAGSLAASQYIQSSNYVSGTTGFHLNADGSAEFSNITARGNIQATSFSQITLAANQHIKYGQTAYNTGTGFFLGDNGAGTPVFSIGVSTGNRMTWDGSTLSIKGDITGSTGTFSGALNAATGSFAGSLSAATGTFAGSLSAATGTFSGTLTASAVNAVNTINIAGNAVSTCASAYSAGATASITVNFGTVATTATIIASVAVANSSGDIVNPYYGSISMDGVVIYSQPICIGLYMYAAYTTRAVGSFNSTVVGLTGSHTFSVTATGGSNAGIAVIGTRR